MAFQHIRIKNSNVAGRLPTSAQIDVAELCVNLQDEKLYSKKTDGTIFELGRAGEVPSGGTSDRPSEPSVGDLFFDTDLEALLYWNGAEWQPVGTDDVVFISQTTPADPEAGQLWWADTTEDEGGGRLYVYTGDEWVDVSIPGGALTQADGDIRYLSKTSNDTAAGEITFEGTTTHEGGLEVTGSFTPGTPFNGGLITSGDSILLTKNNGGVGVRANGQMSLGNVTTVFGDAIVTMRDAVHESFTGDVYGIRFNKDSGTGLTGASNVYGYEARFNATKSLESFTGFIAQKGSWGAGVGATELKGFAVENGFANDAGTSYGFYSNISSSGDVANPFNFYAAGDAPSYFRGEIQLSSDPSYSIGTGTVSGFNVKSNGLTIGARNSGSAATTCMMINRSGSTTGRMFEFRENGTFRDAIVLDGSGGVSFGSSDYRLKENIVDAPSAINTIKSLRPVNYNFKSHPGKTRPGFIAHELQEHVPAAVTGTKDATEAIGTYTNPDGVVETEVTEPEAIPLGATWKQTGTRDVYQGVDQTKLIPILTKALQETIAKNEDLEARLAALEGA